MVNKSAKKKVDKSKEFHFHLVSRSLADPLTDIPGESQSVLQPFVPPNDIKKGRAPKEAPGTALGLSEDVFGFHENLDEREREQIQTAAFGDKDKDAQLDELDENDCYFPPDGYDYEKHMRAVGLGGGKLVNAMPSFPNFMQGPGPGQQSVGEGYVLSTGAPADARALGVEAGACNEPDPDRITPEERDALAALDAADTYEDGDEDFFGDLVGEGDVEEADASLFNRKLAFKDYVYDDDEEYDEDDENAPRQRTAEDSAFDALLDEYDEEQLGALEGMDDEDVCGSQQIETFEHLFDQHIERPVAVQARVRKGLDEHLGEDEPAVPGVPEEDESEPWTDGFTVVDTGPEYDCESILSFRSNLSNHPGKVERPDKKVCRGKKENKEPLPEIDETEAVVSEISTFRPKEETLEDKKLRKAAVKEHQRLCRTVKKETKDSFKEMAKKAGVKPTAGDIREGIRRTAL